MGPILEIIYGKRLKLQETPKAKINYNIIWENKCDSKKLFGFLKLMLYLCNITKDLLI